MSYCVKKMVETPWYFQDFVVGIFEVLIRLKTSLKITMIGFSTLPLKPKTFAEDVQNLKWVNIM